MVIRIEKRYQKAVEVYNKAMYEIQKEYNQINSEDGGELVIDIKMQGKNVVLVKEITKDIEYEISVYYESGTEINSALNGQLTPAYQKQVMKELRALRAAHNYLNRLNQSGIVVRIIEEN